MYKTRVVRQIGMKFALLLSFALPGYAGIIIPPIEWGSGIGDVFANVYNYNGTTNCDLGPSVSTCAKSIASNLPPGFMNSPNGTASGTVSASTDANGTHLYASAGASGLGWTTVTGSAQIYDTVYNPTASAAQFQLTFHLDGSLFTRSSAIAQLNVAFNNMTLFQGMLNYGGAGTYDFINQNFTTAVQTVAANSYENWNLVLSTTVAASSDPSNVAIGGLPFAAMDASNTLSLSAITITDAQGNPLTASGLTSYAGLDYSSSNSSAAPEPASAGLFGGTCILLVLGRYRRAKEIVKNPDSSC
jgi:hypothetical protein